MGVAVSPVHHVRDDDKWLKRYMDDGYDYIFLGGMVPEGVPVLQNWLDHVWHHYLTNQDGTPRVKVHGFGLTTFDLMFRYPWHSVDSTTWVKAAQFGTVLLDIVEPDGRVRIVRVAFSSKSLERHNLDSWHFWSLTKPEQAVVLERLEEMEAERFKDPEVESRIEEIIGYKPGFNVRTLVDSYTWRDNFNIAVFKRAMDRIKIEKFTRQQETLF
jgi:hypothetical protein